MSGVPYNAGKWDLGVSVGLGTDRGRIPPTLGLRWILLGHPLQGLLPGVARFEEVSLRR